MSVNGKPIQAAPGLSAAKTAIIHYCYCSAYKIYSRL